MSHAGSILCVEDDPDTRELLMIVLGEAGYLITCAVDGVEALEVVQQSDFDLFIIDYFMPRLDGVQLTKQLKTLYAHTPVLFYTAATDEQYRSRAIEAGAEAYLAKPVGLNSLLDEVRLLVVQGRELKRNASHSIRGTFGK
jgi:CheY-like chemotaxis protein